MEYEKLQEEMERFVRQVPQQETDQIAPLFAGWQETMIWSCLQGYMGQAYAAEPFGAKEGPPLSAAILSADFCFFAGKPEQELVRRVPLDHPGNFLILVPRNEEWSQMIRREWGQKVQKITRFATKKEPEGFDRKSLEQYGARIPEGFEIRPIDRQIYEMAAKESWSKDLRGCFQDFQMFQRWGLGMAALDSQGKLAAGAASYTVYGGGIEIEIDTKEEYRRKGLALACGAKLILECLERGLYPSWDAHDRRSLALAQKLGYRLDYEYPAYVADPHQLRQREMPER